MASGSDSVAAPSGAVSRARLLRLVVLAAACAFLVVLWGGHDRDWHWTGFRGNTLFDWIELVVAPLLLPFVLVPVIEATTTPELEARAAASPAG